MASRQQPRRRRRQRKSTFFGRREREVELRHLEVGTKNSSDGEEAKGLPNRTGERCQTLIEKASPLRTHPTSAIES